MQQTAAGTRIVSGKDSKAMRQQMSAAANNVSAAEQKRRAGMTNQQRWDEDFNNHLSDQAGAGKDQYNIAYDNYSKDLDAAVARGSMTAQQAAAAKQHVINGVRAKQRAFHKEYLDSFNGGDYTDSNRQGIRNQKIWTTHGDNGLVHFRHGDFGENTTFGGAERGYAQRDARTAAQGQQQQQQAQRTNVAQRANVAQGITSQTTNNAQVARPNDASRYDDMIYGNGQKRLVTKRNGERVPNPVFKGGYTVNVDTGAVDWGKEGDGSINVGGTKYTADQYNAYNNVRSSLAKQFRLQEGLGPEEAKARATQLANQWMADQVAVAQGGKAQNRWQHVENPQPAAQQTPQPAAQPVTQETPQVAQPADQEAPQVTQPVDQEAPQVTQPVEQQTTQPTEQPAAQPGDEYKDTVWTADAIRNALNDQRTSVAEGLTALPGYDNLLFTKKDDKTGGIYDRTGKQLTYKGKAINSKLLRTDNIPWWQFWKDGDYGADILHNAYQAMQTNATSNYNDEEMRQLGFTRVPGSKRWFVNAQGQFVDISGELAPEGTIESQLEHGRTFGQRWNKDTSDPFGIFYSGTRQDVRTR